jgi:RNA polymerase sigma-70 factor (ECF subfamily)
MNYAISSLSERRLLEAVGRGDEEAFRRLVEPYQPGLRAHCHRMLGSLHDAEDALQDALLRAWRGLRSFEGRSSLRRWLYRIATNASLDAIARRPEHVLSLDFALPVDVDTEGPAATYERHEAVELAFVAALRHLPPRQRAVLVLREVLGFSANEVAQALGTTVAAVNSGLQRARKTLHERPLHSGEPATAHSLGDERARAMAENVVDAFERGDVAAIVALLAADATSPRERAEASR